MSESVTIGDQSFIKDPAKGWIDKKTKQPADKGLLRLLDSLDIQPVQKRLKVDIDNTIEPITLSATEKYVFDRNSGWIDAKTKKPAAPDMLKLLDSLKSKVNIADDTSKPTTPKPTPKAKPKPKKPAAEKPAEPTEVTPETEEPVKGSKFKALAKGAGGILASAGAGMFGINLQKTLEEEKEKKEAAAERLQEIKDTYYSVEESETGVKKYRDAKTGRFISAKTAADYDILAQEEFKKEKRKKLLKDVGKGFASGFLGSYGIDLPKILEEEKAKKEAAAKASGEEEPEVDETKKGPAEKGPKSLDKPSISALSNSFTNLITAFNGMDTYSKNINAIFKAQQDAKADVAKENVLETDITPAPVASGGGDSSSEYLASALPGVTEQLETLTDLISSGALQSGGSGSGPLDLTGGNGGRMSFGKKAAIVGGIAAIGAASYYAGSRSSSPPPSAQGEGAAVKQQTAKAATQAAGVKEKAEKAEKQRQNILSGKSSMLGSFGATMASWLGSTFSNVNEYVSNIGSSIQGAINSGLGAIEQGAAQLTGSTGSTAAEFIANFEGFESQAYLLPRERFYTIGFGHQIQNDDLRSGQLGRTGVSVVGPQGRHTVVNRSQATALLQEDLPEYEAPVRRALGSSYSKLSEPQKAAFLSYSYNAGGGGVANFIRRNDIVQLIEQNNMPAVATAFRDRGVRTGSGRVMAGLVRRRAAEADLITRGFTGNILQTVAGNVSNVAGRAVETVTGAVGNVLNAVGNFIFPLTNLRVTSRFGPRSSPTRGASSRHGGVDFGPRTPGVQGDPVMAIGPGIVTKAGVGRGYGNVVYVDHGGGMETRYAHLRGFAVGQGQRVTRGQQLGTLGNTGIGTGPHLHFEIRRNGTAIDPLSVLGSAPIRPDPNASEPTVTEDDRPGRRPQAPRPSAVVAETAHAAIDTAARTADRAIAASRSAYNSAASSARSAFNYLTGAPSRAISPSAARRRNRDYQQALGSARTR